MEMILEKPGKPLGRKSYGHIPHLPGSRMGPADHHCHEGQAKICLEQVRDKHDRVIVTEKLDGSCMAVANIDGIIVPLSRAGYQASTSKYEQHSMFHSWVLQNQHRFLNTLLPGERFVGEWLAQAHGTRYNLKHEPFVIFDLMDGEKRAPWSELCGRTGDFITPRLIADYLGPVPLELVLGAIETSPHGAIDPVEGAVWRVERKGEFDFMAKWVRPDKIDGKYLPEVSKEEAIWNWRF